MRSLIPLVSMPLEWIICGINGPGMKPPWMNHPRMKSSSDQWPVGSMSSESNTPWNQCSIISMPLGWNPLGLTAPPPNTLSLRYLTVLSCISSSGDSDGSDYEDIPLDYQCAQSSARNYAPGADLREDTTDPGMCAACVLILFCFRHA